MNGNRLKDMLKAGEPVICGWLTLNCPAVAEILAWSGYDGLVVDTEHGAIDVVELQVLLQAIASTGQAVVPLVRVPWNDAVAIKRVLDAGAYGVVVPMVNSREEAEKAVQAAKYPPEGIRGVGVARACRWGMMFGEYVAQANNNMVVVLQIEHIEGVRDVERITDVEGLDAVLVGPADLAASLGLRGRADEPVVQEAITRVLETCHRKGVPAGIHVMTPGAATERIRQGFRFIGLGLDGCLLGEASRASVSGVVRG